MYLAINDEEINRKQTEIYSFNKKIIDDFGKLPFWKKWILKDKMKYQVEQNWLRFNLWMKKRVQDKNREDKLELNKY